MKMSKVIHLVPREVCSTPVNSIACVCPLPSCGLSENLPRVEKQQRRKKYFLLGQFLWSKVEEVAFRLGQVRTYDKEE